MGKHSGRLRAPANVFRDLDEGCSPPGVGAGHRVATLQSDEDPTMNHRQLEETLARLDSVDAVRVVTDGDRVSEVHVLAAPGKAAKQVVRDVQSLSMAKFGTNIDRRVISVVQIAPENIQLPDSERPSINAIHEAPDGPRTAVSVTLRWQGIEYVGKTTGPSAASARLRLLGEATLMAVEEMVEGAPPLALDAIGTSTVGMRRILLAVVVSSQGNEEDVVVGASLSNGDDSEAAVRAVLDALNRRMPRMGK